MHDLVTIIGGSGFVGRYIARRMAKQGWRVRVAVRRPNEALFVKPYGSVGQVEPVLCNIRDDNSVEEAVKGASCVINCVGILAETGKQKFDAVQAEGAGRVARAAAQHGVARLIHISAIGANADSPSHYARSKAQGESLVTEAFPGAIILRPSIIFGPEDQFFNRFAKMATRSPILPIVGAQTRFQPVYVDDVAAAAQSGALGEIAPGVYELGGPEQLTFETLMRRMLSVIQRKKIVVNIPFGAASLMGKASDIMTSLSGGLVPAAITADQVANLRTDNCVSETAMGFAEIGISPTGIDAVLPEYLWPFRPSGQYAAIKSSAEHLRDT